MSLHWYGYYQYPAHSIAAASILMARVKMGFMEWWPVELVLMTGIEEKELKLTCHILLQMMRHKYPPQAEDYEKFAAESESPANPGTSVSFVVLGEVL
jgi:hypothetical protein